MQAAFEDHTMLTIKTVLDSPCRMVHAMGVLLMHISEELFRGFVERLHRVRTLSARSCIGTAAHSDTVQGIAQGLLTEEAL